MYSVRHYSKYLFLLGSGFIIAQSAIAQSSVNAAGGDATGTGGSAAYSIGQVVYTTNSNSSGSVAQGVQHAYEIFPVGLNESALAFSLLAFPNPTQELLNLEVSDPFSEKLCYRLYDEFGQVVKAGEINACQTQINTASLPVSTYFLHVVNHDNVNVRSFKIIKN